MIYEHYIVWGICLIGIIGIIMLGSMFISSDSFFGDDTSTQLQEITPKQLMEGELPTKDQLVVEEL